MTTYFTGDQAKVCSVDGCDKKKDCKGLCQRHYLQVKKHGKVMSSSNRVKNDPNEFVVEEDVCKIGLYDDWGNQIAEAVIDAEDHNKVKNYKWHLDRAGYTVAMKNKKSFKLHRVIMDAPEGIEVDHEDHDKLDNRKCNLRLATGQQNQMNQTKRKGATSSKYKGVYWAKREEKWCATIMVSRKKVHIGYYNFEIEAAKAYDKKALELFDKFALTNNRLDLL